MNDVHFATKRPVTTAKNLLDALVTQMYFSSRKLSVIHFDAHEDENLPTFMKSSETLKLLATLHCVYPEQLLPALDILDKASIECIKSERLLTSTENSATEQSNQSMQGRTGTSTISGVYYVSSLAGSTPKSANKHQMSTAYEVRLISWSCNCPYYVVKFLGTKDAQIRRTDVRQLVLSGTYTEKPSVESHIPDDASTCRHLLACFILENLAYFHDNITMTQATAYNLAAKVAGWDYHL